MYEQVEKSKENQTSDINSQGQKKSNDGQRFGDNRPAKKKSQNVMTHREAVRVMDELLQSRGNTTDAKEKIVNAWSLEKATIRDYAHCDSNGSMMHISVEDNRTSQTYHIPVHSPNPGHWHYDDTKDVIG